MFSKQKVLKMDEGHWSEPLTLRKLVEDRLFPCLIRLEEGTRGREERLSFSSGDIMALQGSVAVKDKPLILAHYMVCRLLYLLRDDLSCIEFLFSFI